MSRRKKVDREVEVANQLLTPDLIKLTAMDDKTVALVTILLERAYTIGKIDAFQQPAMSGDKTPLFREPR